MNSRSTYSIDTSQRSSDEHAEYNAGDNPADALHKAAEIGDVAQMEEILRHDPRALDRFHSVHGTTPLCWAADNDRDSSALDFLIRQHADPLIAPRTAYFYYPIAFLISLSPEIQPQLHKNLLSYVQERVVQLFPQMAMLSRDYLISIYYNVLLLIGHDACTLELRTNLSKLKQQIMQRVMTEDERAIISLSLMLAESANLSCDLSLLDKDPCLELISDFPAHIKNDELSCELYLYANHAMEKECSFDLSPYYELALKLMHAPNPAFRAAIHLKKSIYHANSAFESDSDSDSEFSDNEMESESEDEKSVEEPLENLTKFHVENAVDILNNLSFKNDMLALLLRVTVVQVYPVTKTFDSELLLNLLSLSRHFEVNEFALQEIQIIVEVIMAKQALYINDHIQVCTHLTSILIYHRNLIEIDRQIDRPLEASHSEIMGAILEFIGRRSTEILLELAVGETNQYQFDQVLNIFLLCVIIMDYYDLASQPLNFLDDESLGFETLFNFKVTLLTNPATLLMYHPSLEKVLADLLQRTKKYTLTINLIRAAYDIFKTKNMAYFPNYEACLMEALRTTNYSIFTKGLHEIVPMLSFEDNGSLTALVNSLAEHFETFRNETSTLFVELIFNNFIVVHTTHPWLANIYYQAIESVIAEKAAHARIPENYEKEQDRQQAETLCKRMDGILVPQGHPSLFNRFCMFTLEEEQQVNLPLSSGSIASGMRLT
jgi:hypothetical protein